MKGAIVLIKKSTRIAQFLYVCFSFYVFRRLPNVKIFWNVCFGFLVWPRGLKYIEKQRYLLTFQSQMKHTCITYHILMCFYLCLVRMSHTSKCNLGLSLSCQICVIADCLHRVEEMEPFGWLYITTSLLHIQMPACFHWQDVTEKLWRVSDGR